MDSELVECLRCGEQRRLETGRRRSDECPRCGYLGWARAAELSERVRRLLRDVPVEARAVRLHLV